MPDIFDQIDTHETQNSGADIFDKVSSPEQSWPEWLSRTAASAATGIASATTYGLATNLSNLLAMGDVNDPEELERIKEIAEREGIPFDEEKYKEAAQQALGSFPTPSNIARMTEEATDIPLTPKDKFQKAIELGSMATKFQPGTVGQKAAAGVTAPTVSHGLQESGVPEPLAELAGLGVGGYAGSKSPKIDIGKSRKPSGISERGFENIKKPREVSEKKLNQINEKVESDFKEISNKIIKESPVGETFDNLKNEPTYKQESRELLNQAQEIADTIPKKISSKLIKKELADTAAKQTKGYALNEYDKNYMKFMKESIEDVIPENVTAGELVQQYRKNNSALSEYFEPGSSKALNRSKRDAILDNNRAIANVIEKVDPELSTVFKEGNERWTKIMDAEAIDSFIEELFSEKVNYKKMHDFFDKNGYDRIFKRSLGEKGYKNFEQLLKDMLESEAPYKMLKVAKAKGFEDLFHAGMGYVIHPKIGLLKAGISTAKSTTKSLMNVMLDKPKVAITWKKGIDNLKKGNFTEAEKAFSELNKEVIHPDEIIISNKEIGLSPDVKESSRKEALKKFNNRRNKD